MYLMNRRIGLLLGAALACGCLPCAAAELEAQLAVLEAAAGKGEPAALTQLAQRYEHAEGVPRDFLKANELYCEAARAGYADAQFKLGWIYANGRGVPRD